MSGRGLKAGGLAVVAMLMVACSAGGTTSSATPSASASASASVSAPASAAGVTITAYLTEFKIALSTATAAAGAVTFNVMNSGTMPHEFVVLQTDTPAADLPLVDGKVNEDAFTSMGEVGELAPGASGTMTADFPAGHYAIICNLPGHVSQGMVVDFTVQ
jgi:uncharacterized cupredoxin-like copper-binding protein